MTQEDIALRLNELTADKTYQGQLTKHVLNSIKDVKSNYTVVSLLQYCQDMGITVTLEDNTTEDRFVIQDVLDAHKILHLLMHRYLVDVKDIFRLSGVHYTPPKSSNFNQLEYLKKKGVKFATPLSIRTFLAVCDVLHCNILFSLN